MTQPTASGLSPKRLARVRDVLSRHQAIDD
jgi:hypothetical protein